MPASRAPASRPRQLADLIRPGGKRAVADHAADAVVQDRVPAQNSKSTPNARSSAAISHPISCAARRAVCMSLPQRCAKRRRRASGVMPRGNAARHLPGRPRPAGAVTAAHESPAPADRLLRRREVGLNRITCRWWPGAAGVHGLSRDRRPEQIDHDRSMQHHSGPRRTLNNGLNTGFGSSKGIPQTTRYARCHAVGGGPRRRPGTGRR